MKCSGWDAVNQMRFLECGVVKRQNSPGGYSKSGGKLTHRWPGCPGGGTLPRKGRRSVTVPCGQAATLPSDRSPFALPQRDCRPEILSILEL